MPVPRPRSKLPWVSLPTPHLTRRHWRGWAVAVGLMMFVVALASLPPFVAGSTRATLMAAFEALCHQLPGRSPQVGEIALAVCHRCYGLYLGLLFGTLGALALLRWDGWFRNYAPALLALTALPLALDWGLDVLGFWTNTPATRTLTGGWLGLLLGYTFARLFLPLPQQMPPPSQPSLELAQ